MIGQECFTVDLIQYKNVVMFSPLIYLFPSPSLFFVTTFFIDVAANVKCRLKCVQYMHTKNQLQKGDSFAKTTVNSMSQSVMVKIEREGERLINNSIKILASECAERQYDSRERLGMAPNCDNFMK